MLRLFFDVHTKNLTDKPWEYPVQDKASEEILLRCEV